MLGEAAGVVSVVNDMPGVALQRAGVNSTASMAGECWGAVGATAATAAVAGVQWRQLPSPEKGDHLCGS